MDFCENQFTQSWKLVGTTKALIVAPGMFVIGKSSVCGMWNMIIEIQVTKSWKRELLSVNCLAAVCFEASNFHEHNLYQQLLSDAKNKVFHERECLTVFSTESPFRKRSKTTSGRAGSTPL